MKKRHSRLVFTMLGIAVVAAAAGAHAAPPAPLKFTWSTVVNNNDLMPGAPLSRTFNSYNPPSVNVNGLVVMRARSRGGQGQPATHGIYTRNMSVVDSPIVRILDRSTEVPQPNNLETTFVETPSFPRIDMWSDTIVTRGNHPPVWEYTVDGEHTRAGTTGIYTNPFDDLITGASKLGDTPDFAFFEVPEFPDTRFEVFPGAPSVTEGNTIVFKGNYAVNNVGKTGVYYRDLVNEPIPVDGTSLVPAGGTLPVVLIANNTDTVIPGTTTVFGSTSPPSAADGMAVFAGFDNEQNPTLGGIYQAPLAPYESGEQPPLSTLVSIGERVPGESVRDTFNGLGEGGAFDGRYVGFWGAWGPEKRTMRLYCPQEGNRDRIDYCNQELVCSDTDETLGDLNSVCNDTSDPNWPICYQEKQVPVNQGIFVHDIKTNNTRTVAKTGVRFDEFLFWNYSGKVPCVGSGHGEEGDEDDGELARWRSSAFMAVAGRNNQTFFTAFKAVKGNQVGIYLARGPGQAIFTVLDTTTDGQALDAEAPAGSTVTEVSLEREGLRGDWLAVSAKMGIEGGTEEEGMAGIYLTQLPEVP